MLYDVDSVSEYMEALESDWRKEKLLELRAIILKQTQAITESINYKMLCFKLEDTVIFHLNAQSGYVSLYCGNIKKVDPTATLLKGLNIGKGCIRFSKSKKVAETKVEAFIGKAVSMVEAGEDIDC